MDTLQSPVVVWFRRDLRLDDHPALTAAVASGRPVVPVLVVDPRLVSAPAVGPRRVARFLSAAVALDRDLRAIGGRLVLRHGDPRDVIPRVVAESGATQVLGTRDVTPFAVRRDRAVRDSLGNVPLRLLPGLLVVEPEATGEVRVFTPFHRRWAALPLPTPLDAPSRLRVPDDVRGAPMPDATPLGGPEALARLEAFVRSGRAGAYASARDRLDLDGTSGLSADLHLGTLSARRVAAALAGAGVDGSSAFLRQLAWRDWAHHQLWHRADNADPDDPAGRGGIAWREDPAGVGAWLDGRTGYPTVDAAMRQLRANGWIHNRARMIAASFLVKHLLVDWHVGASHFLRELEDGDVANNLLGWRWTAGIGADAAPFVRIFNPVLQGERFDPHGTWVRRWVPEVAGLPDGLVHRPWSAPIPPSGYPTPIVDHRLARERALAAFAHRTRADDAGQRGRQRA